MSFKSDLSVEALKKCLNKDRRRAAMEALTPPQMDAAEAQCFRAWVRSQGGPLKFAISLLGEEAVKVVRKHIKQSRLDPDCEVRSFVELIYGRCRTSERSGPSAAFLAVFETEVARKPYVQTVDGRAVPSFELDTSEQLSNKVVIPYVRNKDGVVMTQAHYKQALGIKMDPKNEEWDRRPVLEIFITRKGGVSKTLLAVPVLIKLRHEYDVALGLAVEAMNMAKEKGVFNPEVKVLFAQAKTKKIPWMLLRDAIRSFSQRVANDGQPMTLDTGFGPWPCQGMAFTKGNFALAVRVLKDDMTDQAKAARLAHVASWKEQQKAARLKEAMDQCGDIPMI